MKRLISRSCYILGLCLLLMATTHAEDITFDFEIPTIPFPPEIKNVNAPSVIMPGALSFSMSAEIVGQVQKKGYCDVIPRSDCEADDWEQIPDPDVSPNPPTIEMVRLYYYVNDNVTAAKYVSMTRGGGDLWTVEVSDSTQVADGDIVTMYIVAVDSRGNVAAQVPDTAQRPCPSASSWNATLSTPSTNSCAYASSYTQCNENVIGTPGPCSTSYTIGDKQGDVCGEPDGAGDQDVISGPNADKVDMLGISAGADSQYICTSLGLGAPPPDPNNPAPIEGYLMIFFNPDQPDPNPADTHIENAYAVTYAPEAVGSDPTLVRVLWSGDCVTNPNTSNPLDCKLITAVGSNENLKVQYDSGSLRYMVKHTGTGNPYNVSYSVIGSTTKQSILVGLTGEINLSGGTAFWISDLTPGFAFYHKNYPVPVSGSCVTPPAAPAAMSALCGNGDDAGENYTCTTGAPPACTYTASGASSSVCEKSASAPSANECVIAFNTSPDSSMVSEYRIYRNTVDNAATAALAGAVAEDGSPVYEYKDTHSTFDGQTYYYYVTSYYSGGDCETKRVDAAEAACTVEDRVAPAAPQLVSAETPPGQSGICRLDWSMPADDPSMDGFTISRDGSPAPDGETSASAGTLTYDWTDSEQLQLGTSYAYAVTAEDLGGNTAVSGTVNCTPEDRQAPEKISSFLVSKPKTSGVLGANVEWQASPETDIGGYNVYVCKQDNSLTDCRESAEFAALNSSMLGTTSLNSEDPAVFTGEGDYCFYVEACDNCAAQGTCPSNGGTSNCSGFPEGGADNSQYVKCPYVDISIDLIAPSAPATLNLSAPSQGKTCELSWPSVCSLEDGEPFADCENPTSSELIGYKIMRNVGPGVESPITGTPIGMTLADQGNTYADTGLVNGQNYCYQVFAMDSSGNFSPQPGNPEECCVPERTDPPDKPVLQKPIPKTSMSCTPTWDAIDDDDEITYSVYRCDGDLEACADSSDFTAIETGILETSSLTSPDYEVIPDDKYTYCVTAVVSNAGGLESAIRDTGITNCGVCIPSDRPQPPTDVATTTNPGTCDVMALSFTRSVDDSGEGGYNLYRCTDADCDHQTKMVDCTELPAGGSNIVNIGPDNPLPLGGEDPATYYYAATYQSDCSDPYQESFPAVDETLDPDFGKDCGACTNPGKCVIVSSCKDYAEQNGCVPIAETDTSSKDEDGTFASSPMPGVQVELLDSSGNVVATASTDSSGNYKIELDNTPGTIDIDATYKVVLHISSADKGNIACTPGYAGDDCYVALTAGVKLEEGGDGVKISGLEINPNGGRADIGNPDCSDSVDVGDLLILKAAFSANKGDEDYETFADFNGDGSIDVQDFLIFKKNFGKFLDHAPAFEAGMCKPE